MVCTFHWKQPIGHFGNKITVMGVHGHHHTMNMKFAKETTDEWWDRLKNTIVQYGGNFLAGDFNMSLTQVVPRLQARGLQIDTCGWYPWLHEEKGARGHCLGIDSCAMSYIGGNVHCQMQWDIKRIGSLLKSSACRPAGPLSRTAVAASAAAAASELDTYPGVNVPGQLWNVLKSKKRNSQRVQLGEETH